MSKLISKSEFLSIWSEQSGFTKKHLTIAFDSLEQTIDEAIRRGGSVKIGNWVIIEKVENKDRPRSSPTGVEPNRNKPYKVKFRRTYHSKQQQYKE